MSSKFSFCLRAGLFCSLLFLSTYHPVSAEIMGNSQFHLDTSGTNANSQTLSTPPNNSRDTIKNNQNISKDSSSITSIGGLGLSISAPYIDYGDIMPGEPILRTLHLTITSNQTAYSLLLSEDQKLTGQNAAIPDTSCDNGSCTPSLPAVWQSPLTFGFGFRCSSVEHVCIPDFVDQNTYQPVPNESEDGITTISSSSPSTYADLIFKVNVPGSQTHTTYHNNINLILLPKI